jgi:hypothetical protein
VDAAGKVERPNQAVPTELAAAAVTAVAVAAAATRARQ